MDANDTGDIPARGEAAPRFSVRPVGRVRSPLSSRAEAPRQGDEGAPEAWVDFEPAFARAAADLRPDTDVLVLTWLDRARRDVTAVHPRGEGDRPETGVFSTRSPDRPNPIGLHRVRIVEVAGLSVRVRRLEALDGTPVIDVKPVLGDVDER